MKGVREFACEVIYDLLIASVGMDFKLLHLVLINNDNDKSTLRHLNPMSFVYVRSSIARELCRCNVCRVLTNTWDLALHAFPPNCGCSFSVASSGNE